MNFAEKIYSHIYISFFFYNKHSGNKKGGKHLPPFVYSLRRECILHHFHLIVSVIMRQRLQKSIKNLLHKFFLTFTFFRYFYSIAVVVSCVDSYDI